MTVANSINVEPVYMPTIKNEPVEGLSHESSYNPMSRTTPQVNTEMLKNLTDLELQKMHDGVIPEPW